MEEKNLSEQVKELHNLLVESNKPKEKPMKFPRKAKVKKRKIKKGWVGVLKIDENGNASGTKVQIEGSAFDLDKKKTYHATEGRNDEEGQEILFWNGKYPFLVQETKKKNPKKFNCGQNETYGQRYIQTMMLNDQIKQKKSLGGSWILWIIGGAVVFFIVKTLMDKGSI